MPSKLSTLVKWSANFTNLAQTLKILQTSNYKAQLRIRRLSYKLQLIRLLYKNRMIFQDTITIIILHKTKKLMESQPLMKLQSFLLKLRRLFMPKRLIIKFRISKLLFSKNNNNNHYQRLKLIKLFIIRSNNQFKSNLKLSKLQLNNNNKLAQRYNLAPNKYLLQANCNKLEPKDLSSLQIRRSQMRIFNSKYCLIMLETQSIPSRLLIQERSKDSQSITIS